MRARKVTALLGRAGLLCLGWFLVAWMRKAGVTLRRVEIGIGCDLFSVVSHTRRLRLDTQLQRAGSRRGMILNGRACKRIRVAGWRVDGGCSGARIHLGAVGGRSELWSRRAATRRSSKWKWKPATEAGRQGSRAAGQSTAGHWTWSACDTN